MGLSLLEALAKSDRTAASKEKKMDSEDFRIEPATADDVPLILKFIEGLAEYERLSHEVVATEESLRNTLFGPRPFAEVLIGYSGSEPAGFALFFHSYSTFLGRAGIYIEDIFVLPRWRRKGLGRRFLVSIARLAVERNCGRVEWSVLDWNEPAIRFYRSIGAKPMDEWTVYRLAGDELKNLAG
jgi:GNAT superfamily N-acetyltransferase